MRAALLALTLAILLAGCGSPTTSTPASSTPSTPTPTSASSATAFGVAFSPVSFEGVEIQRFFAEATQLGSVVMWAGPGEDLARNDSAAAVVDAFAKQANLSLAVQAEFAHPNGSFDPDASRAAAVSFARAHRPAYFALGVEVDRLPNATLDALAAWYPATYDAVKQASPTTRVFVTFQYEHVNGEGGGLTAASDGARWDVLSKFPKRDLTAFTTYPGLVLHDAAHLPLGYYANASAHATSAAPLAFTEVGHYADATFTGWESSPATQAAFARAFLNATSAGTRPALALWLMVHDQPHVNPPPFRHMGLVDASGAHRPGWDVWANATGIR